MSKKIPYRFSASIPIIFFILFASVQFFLLLRHKSPYMNDTRFYQHIHYTFQGSTFEEARTRVLAQLNLDTLDDTNKNFFLNENAYRNTLAFFTKRPFYPFTAYLINLITNNEFQSFLLPVFIGYLVVIVSVYYLSRLSLDIFHSTLVTGLFLAFYPFIDWSTYFLTDTIGAAFWLLQLIMLYHYMETQTKKWLFWYIGLFIISLFNREQNLMFVGITTLLYATAVHMKDYTAQHQIKEIFIVTFSVMIGYVTLSAITGQKTIIDTIVYTQNNYGLTTQSYTVGQTIAFWLQSIIRAHMGLLEDLVRHRWWLVVTGLSIASLIPAFKIWDSYSKRLILYSGIASYCALFFYPVLSYRYFFPVVFTITYSSIIVLRKLCRQRVI